MPTLINSTKVLLMMSLPMLMVACGSLGESKIVGSALTGSEIKKLIDGNTIQGPAGGRMYDWYYQADGKVTGVIGASDDDSGTWLIKGANVYCHEWDQYFDGVQHCYQWYKQARSGRYVMTNVDDDRHADIEIWEVKKGNPFDM